MIDHACQAALAGRLVIWEESARDGAQAKTLMDGSQRVALARATGELFGASGLDHVIFAAGFPAICNEEVEIMRQLADEVDNCALASHGRATPADIELGVRALRGARQPRVTFWIPASAEMAPIVGMGSPDGALRRGVEMLQHALDVGGGAPVDIALTDVSRSDESFVAHAVTTLQMAGASIVKLCDSVGRFFPDDSRGFYERVLGSLPDNTPVGVHNHNDFGFALANNLNAVQAGIRVVASSWLGLGERNGLAPTEQLVFALSQIDDMALWSTRPGLERLVPIAQQVSKTTGVPIKVTDAVVGTGVNTISTGTPFLSRTVFQPFDPESVLGVPSKILVTQLANTQVVTAVAAEGGYSLTAEQAREVMRWVKTMAYRRGRAVVPKEEFFAFVAGRFPAPELASGLADAG